VWCRQQDGGHGSWNPHKECVTTHLQNHTAPKTDGAQAVGNFIKYNKRWHRRNCSRQIARHLTIQVVYLTKNTYEWVGGSYNYLYLRIGKLSYIYLYIFYYIYKFYMYRLTAKKRFSWETFELPIVQILVLVARSLTENINRGWPKRRKVPRCSSLRRGWGSP